MHKHMFVTCAGFKQYLYLIKNIHRTPDALLITAKFHVSQVLRFEKHGCSQYDKLPNDKELI